MCVGLWWSLYFQELLLQLHDLPFALLGMIGEFDGDPEQGEAASALQTALKRHVITRCEDPRRLLAVENVGDVRRFGDRQ